MAEVVEVAGICLRVVLGVIFMLTPGMVFWLAVVGIGLAIQRICRADLLRRSRDVL
jgi:hypothetical protein